MKSFKRIIVGLDLTQMDFKLINFMCMFLNLNQSIEDIYFVHVSRNLENIDSEVYDISSPDLPADELIIQKMHSEVAKCIHLDKDVTLHFEVLEGSPLKQLLHWSKIKHIDLIVAGKKEHLDGKGIMMEKLARHSNSSILFVTEEYASGFNHILIPIDFSQRTHFVFTKIKELLNALPQAKITCLNVVDIPTGYTRIGKSFNEFADTMVSHAYEKWRTFIEINQLQEYPLEPVFIKNRDKKIAKIIYDYAYENNVNMIIMGSKEQTNASVFLLGSVAEKLISYDYDVPLLLVKRPGEVYDLQKAIENI